jgi:hypothetical protein
MKGGGVGMRGIVSSLSVQGEDGGMLAAGTWTRWVGLYDAQGTGGSVATWSIAEAADLHAGIGGMGITQTLWSGCGRYLFVVERKSRGVLVFDVRVTGQLVAWLEGREADTNQRLGVDVFEAEGGVEIWAGGVDGIVRVWEGVGKSEGGVERSWEFRAHDGKSSCSEVDTAWLIVLDPIGSTIVHSSGTVVATCSGQRYTTGLGDDNTISDDSSEESDDDDRSSIRHSSGSASLASLKSVKPPRRAPDNSIKVWSL